LEKKEKIKPTYVGKNENLVFIVPKELFTMKLNSDQILDHETAKEFSKYLRGTFKGFQEANKTKYNNKDYHKTETSSEFWSNFEVKAREIGIDLIGYTPVLENYIFKDLPVVGKYAIVLGMEMKWDKIKTAPSIHCGIEAFRVYYELGQKTIELTEFLQAKGYKSEAHHPFGGKLLFTAHAVSANLGIMGRNGLVVTPEFGSRQRWSLITTDAEIPVRNKVDLSSLEEFCEDCGACVKNCLGGAAFEAPIEKIKGSGIITHIDRSKCVESLLENNYCSICLKVCPQGKKT
jgi:epoxyqueuosine reductase